VFHIYILKLLTIVEESISSLNGEEITFLTYSKNYKLT